MNEVPNPENPEQGPKLDLEKAATPPPENLDIAQPAKANEDDKKDKEMIGEESETSPRTVRFGVVTIEEDVNSHLLTEEERQIYQEGFEELKKLVEVADDVEKLYLTHPSLTSVVIGFQGIRSGTKDDAALIYKLYQKAGLDFHENHALLEYQHNDDEPRYAFVNLATSSRILKSHQQDLGLRLSEKPTNQEIESAIVALSTEPPVSRQLMATGFLSGFPAEDVVWFAKQAVAADSSIKMGAQNIWKRMSSEEIPHNYELAGLNFDLLKSVENYKWLGTEALPGIRGFGLAWSTQESVPENTKLQLQKFLELDRELGLLPFIRQVRGTFDRDEVLRTIEVAKSLKEGSA